MIGIFDNCYCCCQVEFFGVVVVVVNENLMVEYINLGNEFFGIEGCLFCLRFVFRKRSEISFFTSVIFHHRRKGYCIFG